MIYKNITSTDIEMAEEVRDYVLANPQSPDAWDIFREVNRILDQRIAERG